MIDVITQALDAIYPDDPPRFMHRGPHGYHDKDRIVRDLAARSPDAAARRPPGILTRFLQPAVPELVISRGPGNAAAARARRRGRPNSRAPQVPCRAAVMRLPCRPAPFGMSSDIPDLERTRRIPAKQQPPGAVVPTEHTRQQGTVVVVHVREDERATQHERETLLGFARRLATLKGYDMGGVYEPSRRYAGPLYFVPCSTLTGAEAQALGIRGVDDLFGGVVPHGFVGTKAISHPLVAPGAAAPRGWDTCFAERLGDAVLAGHVAFAPEDARIGGRQMLRAGRVRIKEVRASGGRGQAVVRDAGELELLLRELDLAEVGTHGVVLEENLDDVRTFSVGQVKVGDLTASYYGSQRLTLNNEGAEVFGGSDLTVARGDFDALLRLAPPAEICHAIEQARRYDAAVHACFPGFFASRKNYDILLGRDARGRWRSGVLEQSWRVGGATGPEIAALEVLRGDPARRQVRASCFEVFGDSPEPPPHATVYFRGRDPDMGVLTKYTVVEEEHVDAR